MHPTIVPEPGSALAGAEEELALAAEELRDAIRKEQEAAAARVQHLGSLLQAKADERVTLRGPIEQRWLKSIRQINGIYEKDELPPKANEDDYGSRVFVPLTRRLRNLVAARTHDILFPSDQRFWVLKPSAMADLGQAQDLMRTLPPQAPLAMQGMPANVQVSDMQLAIEELKKEAEIRADRMQRQIDDRLEEARFPARARRAIDEAIDLGTGVLKGPVARLKRDRKWTPDGLVYREEIVPDVQYVSIWNLFPDLSATSIDECTDVIEAHPMSRAQLADLRAQPGFNSAAIDMVLKSGPRPDTQTRRQDLRALAGLSGAPDERYVVWEYNGPLRGSELNACVRSSSAAEVDEDGAPVEPPEDEFDDDEDYEVTVWFCDSVVIKAIARPVQEPGPSLYSLIYWQRDSASIFGYGLPDEVRDQQTSANSSFRAMLDNMGLSVGPQIVFDDDAIVPLDGRKEMRPMKLWRKRSPNTDVRQAFAFFHVESRLAELGSIFDRSKALIDEVAPGFVHGSDSPGRMQSATQASIEYTMATLWVRRFVRQWDDQVITPLMSRMVDWEMDFNEDESIKGDFNPTARGIAALVELEGQGQRWLQFTQYLQQVGLPLKDQYRVARAYARSLKLDPDDCLPSEEEIRKMQEQPAPPDIEREKLRVAEQNNQMDHQAQMSELQSREQDRLMRAEELARRERLALLEIASRERVDMTKAAEKYGYDLRRIEADLQNAREQREHESRMQNSEIAVKLRRGSGL